jgi:hypothetical protein
LLLGTAPHDGAAAELEAYREEIRAVQGVDVELRLLLEKDEMLNFRSAQATQLLRPGNGRIALRAFRREKALGPLQSRLRVELRSVTALARLGVLLQPSPHFSTEFGLFR